MRDLPPRPRHPIPPADRRRMTRMPADGDNLRERLRRALPAAMKARDRPAIAALRSALAAIDNAEAVEAAETPTGAGTPAFAGTVAGVGAAEAERRRLTHTEMEQILRAE